MIHFNSAEHIFQFELYPRDENNEWKSAYVTDSNETRENKKNRYSKLNVETTNCSVFRAILIYLKINEPIKLWNKMK